MDYVTLLFVKKYCQIDAFSDGEAARARLVAIAQTVCRFLLVNMVMGQQWRDC